MTKITIIGGGNLGQSIATGLLKSAFIAPQQITITRRNVAAIAHFGLQEVQVTNDNAAAINQANWVILAVKPFQVKEVLTPLVEQLSVQNTAIISVVTGVSMEDIKEIVGTHVPVYRAMPNTAIAIQQSMTCLCTQDTDDNRKSYVMQLFNQLGKSIYIDESLMDAATVLGACGTAYAMRFVRANIQGGIEIGFGAEVAALIAAQTVKGAAQLLLENHLHPEQEIDKVTTPKGCTIAGLNEMEHRGFSSSLIKGITTSYHKIKHDM